MQTIELASSFEPSSDDSAGPQRERWVDLEARDDEGRRWLAGQSGLDDEIIGRLLDPAPTTYWRRFGQALYFHVRSSVPGEDTSTVAIVDFGIWLEPGRVITVHHGKVPALEKAAEACSRGEGPSSSWGLIVRVLFEALGRLEHNLHDLTTTIDRLEDQILSAEGDPPIQRIAELQTRLVYARRFRMPLANMVSFVSSQPGTVFDAALRDDLDGIISVVAQHQELLDLLIDRASALQGQIRDRLADSMNSATYRFTWVATVFLPLSFLTGLLGINVAGIPGDHNPLAFWLVCGVLCVIAAAWGIIVGRVTSELKWRRRPRGR